MGGAWMALTFLVALSVRPGSRVSEPRGVSHYGKRKTLPFFLDFLFLLWLGLIRRRLLILLTRRRTVIAWWMSNGRPVYGSRGDRFQSEDDPYTLLGATHGRLADLGIYADYTA